jgi:hypothetical protein
MLLKSRAERHVRDITQTDLLNKIIATNPQRIVPIISNSFRINQIFCDESGMCGLFSETGHLDENTPTIEEQLTQVWAGKVHYPMSDTHNLSRVAHFHQVESGNSEIAKKEYIDFLKSYLLDMSYLEQDCRQLVDELTPDMESLRFSEIVRQLKYPRFPAEIEDPLSLLARLPFPIYITTSYFNFLERALIKPGNKQPRTEVIQWNSTRTARAAKALPRPVPGETNILYEPSVAEPVVYHLFGLEEDPRSLVMSEDDYLKFLITAVSDNNKLHPVVPLRLQQALAESYLLLLGYQLKEWDFRILFRFLLNYRPDTTDSTGIFIQVQPKSGAPNLLDYLSKYFGIEHFDISWKTPERFIQDLWQSWKGERS